MTDQDINDKAVSRKYLEEFVKTYLDLKIGHFELDSTLAMNSFKSDVDSLIDVIRQETSKIIPRYVAKRKTDLRKQDEKFLSGIKTVYKECLKVHDELCSLLQSTKDNLQMVTQERLHYLEFLKICQEITQSELN